MRLKRRFLISGIEISSYVTHLAILGLLLNFKKNYKVYKKFTNFPLTKLNKITKNYSLKTPHRVSAPNSTSFFKILTLERVLSA